MRHEIIEQHEAHSVLQDPIRRTIREEALFNLTTKYRKYVQHLTQFNQHAEDKMMDEYEPSESLIVEEMEVVKNKYFR